MPIIHNKSFIEGDQYVATDSESNAIGFGETRDGAFQDLDTDNRNIHKRLNDLGDARLGPHMISIRQRLNARYGVA